MELEIVLERSLFVIFEMYVFALEVEAAVAVVWGSWFLGFFCWEVFFDFLVVNVLWRMSYVLVFFFWFYSFLEVSFIFLVFILLWINFGFILFLVLFFVVYFLVVWVWIVLFILSCLGWKIRIVCSFLSFLYCGFCICGS